MRAVSYRLRRLIRARLTSTLLLTLIVAILVGVAISCAAGARRTASAPDRFVAANGRGFEAQITQGEGLPEIAAISQLPAVADVQAATFFFGAVSVPGTGEPFDALPFAGSAVPIGAPIIEGRAPDPTNRNEFMATLDLVQAYGLSIGDSFDVGTITPEQMQTQGFNAPTLDGPAWSAVLVGVIDASASLDDTGSILVFSGAVLDDPNIAIASSVMWVDEIPGADLKTLRVQLDTLPNSQNFTLQEVLLSGDVRTAVQAQARGLWLLALVTGIAAIAVLGQLITRQVRLSGADRERLSALGFTNEQLLAESAGRAALPIVAGSALGAALAIAPSGVFPTGFVDRLEPTHGIDADVTALLIGAAMFVVALTAWTVIALLLTTRKATAIRPSPTIETLAARAPTAAAATGLRFAFARRGKDRGTIRGAMAGLILTVAALVGALTFGISLDRLVDQPARFGVNYDISTDDGAEEIPPDVQELIENDPDIVGATLYAIEHARFQLQTIDVAGMDPIRGDLLPHVLTGRLPAAQDEIVLGRLTAHDLDLSVGDHFTLAVGDNSQIYRVTGLVVLPALSGSDGIGHGALLTMTGLRRIVPDAFGNVAVIDVRDDAPRATVERVAAAAGLEGESRDPPSAISNLVRVRTIPYVLAGVLAALLLLTVAHVMLTSLRNGRRDLAILRSLGAAPGWISRAMHWQVTTFALVPIVCGAALGIVAGRLVFQALADSVGAVDDAAIPFVLITVVAVAALALSNAIATIPARRARRLTTATILQAE